MLSRTLSAGVLLLIGTQAVSAADPLIPPAPTYDSSSAIPVPVPPAPGLNSSKILPVPEVPAAPATIAPPVASPPQTITQPSPSVPYPVQSGTTVSPNQNYGNGPVVTSPAQNFSYGYQPDGSYVLPSGSGSPYGDQNYSGYPPAQYNSFSNGLEPQGRYVSGPAGSEHARYPYYSYRRPWYSPGPASRNVNIVW